MKKTLALLLAALLLLLGLAGCGDSKSIDLPEFTATPAFDGNHHSWEYGDDGDLNGDKELLKVTWFINDPSFSWPGNGNSVVSDVIKEKLGIEFEFITPVEWDNSKLMTMINGGTLTDIVSVQSYYPEVSQMALEGYVYPLNPLMDRWAPSFYSILQNDIFDWYKQGDGNTYVLPNYASSSMYVDKMVGGKVEPSGAMMVRQDYLDEYLRSDEAKENPSITTPDGFLAACKWVKAAKNYGEDEPVLLIQFDNIGSPSIAYLSQYFASPFEDEDGEYLDRCESDEYAETLKFLNRLYREGIISFSNLSENITQLGTYIANGTPFAAITTPQNYTSEWEAARQNGITYTTFVITNSKGDTPILMSSISMGYMANMISKTAKRPDRIIKLFEFLYSEEGQRLTSFGVEGDTWTWLEAPTETSFGKIQWTQSYLADRENNDLAKYGLWLSVFANSAYITHVQNPVRTEANIYSNNFKKALTPYSYNYSPALLKVDVESDYYETFLGISSNVSSIWKDSFVPIITAVSDDDCDKKIADTIASIRKLKTDDYISFEKEGYQRAKEALNITWGWPPNDPSFVAPEIMMTGDPSYRIW